MNASAASTLFRFTEPPGTYAVGLSVVEQYDYSRPYRSSIDELGRPFRGQRARPLQTLVWYPAKASKGPAMTVEDYLGLWATERSFEKPRVPARVEPRVPTRAEEWRAGMQPTLEMPLWAVRDAPRALGRFPVVIYSPGHSSPSWENADLCEYLASHGYLVIATPSMGATTRYPTVDLAGIEPQARDIAFLIGYAHTLPNADVSSIAAAGFSWGGICNVVAAARDDRIRAVVCLDGNLRFSPGLLRKAGGKQPEEMTIPLLSIAQGQWNPEDRAQFLERYPDHDGSDVLNAWTHGDLVSIHMLGFTHGEHSSMGQRNEDIWRLMFQLYPARKADYGREDGMVGYTWLARYTLQFLNAYLKGQAPAKSFLKKSPVENGVPPRFMTAQFRAGAGAPVTVESFRAELARKGFDCAAEVYERFQKRRSTFRLDEHVLLAWADELSDQDLLAEAIAVLALNVLLHPASGKGHMSLGDAYLKCDRVTEAVQSYRRGLESAPAWMAAELSKKIAQIDGPVAAASRATN